MITIIEVMKVWEDRTITLDELLDVKGFDIGLKDYEIFDEAYREKLNNAIIEHYRFRNIGFVIPGMFKNRLNKRMNLIMRDKYNALYKAKMQEYNVFDNINLTEEFTHEVSNNMTNNSNSNITQNDIVEGESKEKVISTSYPQSKLVTDDFNSPDYADTGSTDINKSNNTSTSNNTSNSTSTGTNSTIEKYTRTNKGSSAGLSFSVALQQYFNTMEMARIDEMIIYELRDLFITIW